MSYTVTNLPVFTANIPVCRACPSRQRPCGGDCLCKGDDKGEDMHARADRGECPLGRFTDPNAKRGGITAATKTPEQLAAQQAANIARFHAAWTLIHTATRADQAFVDGIPKILPTCDCKKHWKELVARLPPVFGDGWFERTWQWHQAVNERLGKPGISLEFARWRWLHPLNKSS